jgi:hypothetical protein
MKKVSFFCLGMLLAIQTLWAISPEEIISAPEIRMEVYQDLVFAGKCMKLPMPFAKPLIMEQAQLEALKNGRVVQVDLVYSDYPKNADLSSLNLERLKNLETLQPTLFGQEEIKWRVVRQTRCPDKASAALLFHGFVIYYRPVQSMKEVATEISEIKRLTKRTETVKKSALVKDHNLVIERSIDDSTLKVESIDPDLSEVSSSSVKSFSILLPSEDAFSIPMMDTTVSAVLNRNKWKNMLVVADVTGSMYPYTSQLLLWLQLNASKHPNMRYLFFNDGDMTPDNKKVIGKTGGLYPIQSNNYSVVETMIYKAMRAGCGGDGPENNIEAILKGVSLYSDAQTIVMIADNWAPVKDISLLTSLKKPVKIILCGSQYFVNPVYLNIARATGGSVHTMESDILELAKISEGATVTIGKHEFKIVNGKFILVSTGRL